MLKWTPQLLNNKGFQLTGIDLSETMIQIAKELDIEHKINFIVDDVRDFSISSKFDAIISLFHVASY